VREPVAALATEIVAPEAPNETVPPKDDVPVDIVSEELLRNREPPEVVYRTF
jgi:hypothetical protein